MVSPLFIFIASVVSYAFYVAAYAFYNLYLHPLAKYPGPKLWIAVPALRLISANRGLLDIEIRKLHNKHGDVVRFSPNELSFITAEAWRDVYGHGHRELPKLMFGDPNQTSNVRSLITSIRLGRTSPTSDTVRSRHRLTDLLRLSVPTLLIMPDFARQ